MPPISYNFGPVGIGVGSLSVGFVIPEFTDVGSIGEGVSAKTISPRAPSPIAGALGQTPRLSRTEQQHSKTQAQKRSEFSHAESLQEDCEIVESRGEELGVKGSLAMMFSNCPKLSIYDTISTNYMVTEPTSTVRARRLRERRSRGVVLVAPVEVGEGGLGLLISSGLLKEHQTRDRKAVGEACLAALEQWSEGRGARTVGQG